MVLCLLGVGTFSAIIPLQSSEPNLHLNLVIPSDKGLPDRHLRAFSLIEMSVVSAIVGVVSRNLSAPSFREGRFKIPELNHPPRQV